MPAFVLVQIVADLVPAQGSALKVVLAGGRCGSLPAFTR
jgi:hypothetical protein